MFTPGLATFSVNGWIVNSLGFAGHIVSVATIPFLPWCMKADTDNV